MVEQALAILKSGETYRRILYLLLAFPLGIIYFTHPKASNTFWRYTSPRKRLKFGPNGVAANAQRGPTAALLWPITHRMTLIYRWTISTFR